MKFFSPFLLKPNSPKIGKFWFQILVPITYVILLVLFYNLSYELFYSWVLSGEWHIVISPLSMPNLSPWVNLEDHLVSLVIAILISHVQKFKFTNSLFMDVNGGRGFVFFLVYVEILPFLFFLGIPCLLMCINMLSPLGIFSCNM